MTRLFGLLFRSRIILSLVLKVSWRGNLGLRLRSRLKSAEHDLKRVGWTIQIYEAATLLDPKSWKKKLVLGRFSYPPFQGVEGFADPFLVVLEKEVFLFFEAIVDDRGEIWCGKIDGRHLVNLKPVLKEPFHLSFPFIFRVGDCHYMIPETGENRSVRLYKCDSFPYEWSFDRLLYSHSNLADTVFIERNKLHYWFTYDVDERRNRIFVSHGLTEKWQELENADVAIGRNAGAPFHLENRLLRPVQIPGSTYGEGVQLAEITHLNESVVIERVVNPNFMMKSAGYSFDGTHHFHFVNLGNRYIVATDGKNRNFESIAK